MKNKLLHEVIAIVAILTIVSMTVNVAKVNAAGTQFTLEGLTLGPPSEKYTTGLVQGYYECDWIPFNLTIINSESSSISLTVAIDLDYNVTTGSAEGAIGIDAFGIDGTSENMWKVRVINVTNGGTYDDLGPYNPSVVSFPSKDVLRFSFDLTVPANTKVWVLWESHLAKTGNTNLFDRTTIGMGASFWPGARLHVQASLTGDVNGLRTVPIKKPRPKGEIPQATISGVKFHDVDADGVRDDGEEGLEGWTIQLWKFDGDWELVDETTTGSEGDYIFTVTEAGHYNVTEVLESGWMQTAPAGGCYEFYVALGDQITDKDFGNIKLGSISGAKFYDANVNGVWDSGEPPIEGWKVHLTGTNILGDTVDEYAFTDADGKFIFEGLLPGTYTVEEVFPSGMWVNTTVTSFSHELEEGEDYVGPNFGNVCLMPGTGGKTLGFWSNKNGQKLITSSDVNALNELNLYKPTGWAYPPFTDKTQIKNYLLNATAKDMRWMLFAQLIATKLNVLHGFLSGSTIVYVGPSTYVPSGFISIDEIMANANNALLSGTRAEQEYWKNLLDGVNNNRLLFVCPGPCYSIVYP